MIHKEILCQQSPYFKAAFTDHWKEGQENLITLNEVNPGLLSAFVMDWFYTGQLLKKYSAGNGRTDLLLVEAYIFADRYDVPGLRREIVDNFYTACISEKENTLVRYKVIVKAFNNLPATSKLCCFLLDLYAGYWTSSMDDDEEQCLREKLPMSFVMSLMVRLGERSADKNIRNRDDYEEQVGEDAPTSLKEQDKEGYGLDFSHT